MQLFLRVTFTMAAQGAIQKCHRGWISVLVILIIIGWYDDTSTILCLVIVQINTGLLWKEPVEIEILR